jgi:nickel transport protein
MQLRTMAIAILLILLIVLPAAPVFAHNMLVEPVESGKVRVIFDDGSPARHAEVIVYNEQEEEIARGDVDRDGLFSYEAEGAVFILAQDQFGHRAEYTIGEEIGQGLPRVPTVIAVLGVFVLIAGLFHYRINKRESGEDS